MLQLNGINITHSKDLSMMVKDLSCTFNKGDKAVIIGEEGNGKSTLLKYIYDKSLIEGYTETSGKVFFPGESVSYLPQALTDEQLNMTVGKYLGEKPGDALYESDTAPYLWSLGASELEEMRNRRISSLSGGEKIRVQLIGILSERPTVLLLDEPSNDIDIETLEILENIINAFTGIVLFVSHDETLIMNTANIIVHIERLNRKSEPRCTVSRTSYIEYTANRRREFDKQEEIARNNIREKKKRDEKLRKIYEKVDSAQRNVSRSDPSTGRLLKKKMHSVKAMERRFEKHDENITEIPREELPINYILAGNDNTFPEGKVLLDLDLEELVSEDSNNVLSKNIRLFLRGPSKICIVGRNGCGKTTLIRIIAAELLDRKDIKAIYMPQNYSEILDMDQTPVEAVCSSGDHSESVKARNHLAALRFTAEEMEHSISALSSGQQAKLFLLKIEMSGANVLILDEPTRNLSPLSGPVIRRMFKSFPGAIISVSHDRMFILEVCDTVYEMTAEGLQEVSQTR